VEVLTLGSLVGKRIQLFLDRGGTLFPRHSFESVVDRKPLSKITITGFREMRQCQVGSDVLWLLAVGSWLLAVSFLAPASPESALPIARRCLRPASAPCRPVELGLQPWPRRPKTRER